MSLLEVHDVAKTYTTDGEDVPVLRGVSLSVPAGQMHAVTGPSGSGKSTLLQILAGKRLISKEGTEVCIKGRDVFRQYPPGVTFLGTEW